ncbi:MAG: hypothetical protein ACT6QS_07280 [Flavobacteriales bacterium]
MHTPDIDDIKEYLENNPLELFPSQQALSVPILHRMYRKMQYGLQFDEIRIADQLIINGHHRYLSSMLAGRPIGRVCSQCSPATRQYSWQHVQLDTQDWDTKEQIQKFNEEDARFNGIPIQELNAITG